MTDFFDALDGAVHGCFDPLLGDQLAAWIDFLHDAVESGAEGCGLRFDLEAEDGSPLYGWIGWRFGEGGETMENTGIYLPIEEDPTLAPPDELDGWPLFALGVQ